MQFLNYNIEHRADYPWQFVEGRICHLKVQSRESIASIIVFYGDPFCYVPNSMKQPVLVCKEMPCTTELPGRNVYTTDIPMATHKLRYHFVITLSDGTCVFLSESGVTAPLEESQLRPFFVPYVYEENHPVAPMWAEHFVWYQIFPDRFCSDNNEQKTIEFVPSRENFYGGTLKGIQSKIPYLRNLGVQGIYLNPVFSSMSNHRYDTMDYGKIDARLGTEQDLRNLSDAIHAAGMRLMLDGVYNHCGWDNPIWQDVKVNGRNSKYYHWFCIYDDEHLLTQDLADFSDKRMKEDPVYECFAFAANMPKWNTANPEVRQYLIDQALWWTKTCKIDAWRLDVPDEVNKQFLHEFRNAMKMYNPDIYVIGEIWQDAAPWLRPMLYDGTMDYPLYFIIRDYVFGKKDSLDAFAERIARWYLSVPECTRPRQWAFCSNHDLPRTMHLSKGDESAVKTAYFLSTVLGGNLNIYYGEEIMMDGGEDPANRGAMDWTKPECNPDALKYLQELIKLKRECIKGSSLKAMRKEKDALYIELISEKAEYLAVLQENPNQLCVIGNDFTPIFGSVSLEVGGWLIQNQALFMRKMR